jgi:hypothetical protein
MSSEKSPEDALKAIILQEYPELGMPETSDYEKVKLLRHWTASIIDFSTSVLLINKRVNDFYNLSAYDLYLLFINNKGGTLCGGSAVFLQKVYRLFGFEAYILNYGTEDAVTHMIDLVKIDYNGREILTVQGAYFDVGYENKNGEPIDYFDMLQLLVERRGDEIYAVEFDPPLMRDYLQENLEDTGLIKSIVTTRVVFTTEFALFRVRPYIDKFLTDRGLPLDDIYLYLFPFSISGDAQGKLMAKATQITGSPRPVD